MTKSSSLLLLLLIVLSAYPKKAIIIGASSGIGKEVAKRLSKQGYTVGLVARRLSLLESLQKELPNQSYVADIDVTTSDARAKLEQLMKQMKQVDLVVISISSYLDNKNDMHNDPTSDWRKKERILDVDCKGFIAMADVAFTHFMEQNSGHLVGISSSSGLKGNASTPEYSGAKACISTYMEGMRNLMARENKNVFVTDVIPGFVAVEHSPLGEDPDAYREILVEEAGETIIRGITERRKTVYVPSRVWLVSLLKFLPDCMYQRFFNWM